MPPSHVRPRRSALLCRTHLLIGTEGAVQVCTLPPSAEADLDCNLDHEIASGEENEGAARGEATAAAEAAEAAEAAAPVSSARREFTASGNVPSPSGSPSESPAGSPRSSSSGGKLPRPPRTPPSARRSPSAAAAANDETRKKSAALGATPEKRAYTAERAARSLVERVRRSAERRVDEATREAQEARAVAHQLREDLASCRAELDAAIAVAARAEAAAEFDDSSGGRRNASLSTGVSATRVARLDAAFAAACSTLEALGETAAMAAMGGWIAVAETLEAPVPGVATLEGLADESGKDARLSPDTFGRAGSKPETRMCRAVRDVVAAVRDAAAVAAAAEERVIGGG